MRGGIVALSFLLLLPAALVAQPATSVPQAVAALAQARRALPIQPNSGAYAWDSGAYQYDAAGNIVAIGGQYYRYDTDARLVLAHVTHPEGTDAIDQTFAYDAYGNMKGSYKAGVTTTYTTSTSTNRMTSRSAAYDAAGNLTQYQPNGVLYTYNYDALNMLSSIQYSASGGTQTPAVYVYTADDERLRSFTGATSHYTVRDVGGKVLRDYQFDGSTWTIVRDYVYRGGQLLSAITPSTLEEYSLDHLGSPRLITDTSGVKLGFHTYLPYGEEWIASSQQPNDPPMKFTGHERDQAAIAGDMALDYLHARYYGAGVGRFLSTDPLLDFEHNAGEPQRWNQYAYATNNPVKYVDADGRDKKIYILQSFAYDSTMYFWSRFEKLATNGYEVDPHRFASEATYYKYLAKADKTDFVFTFSHASYTGISDANFFSKDAAKQFDNSAISASALAAAVNRDTDRPAGIALIGCNTIRPAQELANRTGVAVVGSRGLVTFGDDKRAIAILTAYVSQHGRIDQAAIDQVNKTICPSGACTYRYDLALPQGTK